MFLIKRNKSIKRKLELFHVTFGRNVKSIQPVDAIIEKATLKKKK